DRALFAQVEYRRAAAADQRAQGRHVAGRPAPARALAQPRIRAQDRALCAPPQRAAGHHRVGAGQRLARRNRHRRQDAWARRPRPLLHRQLVAVVRSADFAEAGVVAGAVTQGAYSVPTVIATRKPIWRLRMPASPPRLRTAVRQDSAVEYHEPPRSTRLLLSPLFHALPSTGAS